MTNLDSSISEWRRQMLASGVKTPVPLEELELHLREEIEQLVKSGRPDAEAFEMAVQGIGQAQLLQNEFKKNDEAKKACNAERAVRRVRVLMILSGLGLAVALLLKAGNFSRCSPNQQISCLIAVLMYLLPPCSVRLISKIFPVIRDQRKRTAVGLSGGALLILWFIVLAYIAEPRFDLDMGQLIVAVVWTMVVPVGLFAGVAFGIEAAAQRNLKTGGS